MAYQDLDKAERFLVKGLEIARQQKAKSLELRLCISVYDLYQFKRTADQYRPQLAKIYESFTEGFDTRDLVRARARLQTGGSSHATA